MTGKTKAQDVLFSAAGAMIAATMTSAIVASQTGRKRDDRSRPLSAERSLSRSAARASPFSGGLGPAGVVRASAMPSHAVQQY